MAASPWQASPVSAPLFQPASQPASLPMYCWYASLLACGCAAWGSQRAVRMGERECRESLNLDSLCLPAGTKCKYLAEAILDSVTTC